MRILAISGSLRAASSTGAVVRMLAALAEDVTIYESLGELPHFSPDLDLDPPPPAVAHLRALVANADAVVICTPEYAYGMPGSLKNMLDWLVSFTQFAGKPVAPMSASPSAMGGARAHAWLVQTLTAMSANIVEGASLTIPFVKMKLAEGTELRAMLSAALTALAKHAAPDR